MLIGKPEINSCASFVENNKHTINDMMAAARVIVLDRAGDLDPDVVMERSAVLTAVSLIQGKDSIVNSIELPDEADELLDELYQAIVIDSCLDDLINAGEIAGTKGPDGIWRYHAVKK